MFDKSEVLFPSKREGTFLAHCAVSPLYSAAAEQMAALDRAQMMQGIGMFKEYPRILLELHEQAARLLKTSPDNLSFVASTAEGMNIIANGLPLSKGEEIVSYEHEYPANFYPWKLQEKRGAKLVLLSDSKAGSGLPSGMPRGFDLAELEKRVNAKTKVIALSHVQYSSGFAVDLKALGAFCRERSIHLVIDAAQSLGSLPLYPEELGIAAIAASGWKWLLGPIGASLLYTSPAFREEIEITMSGADQQRQSPDYLDLSWNPHQSGRRFEYSTCSLSPALGLSAVLKDVFNRYGIEAISAEIFRLQQLLLDNLEKDFFQPVLFREENRSGILSVRIPDKLDDFVTIAAEKGIILVPRAGYLRLAPHFYHTDEEIIRAAETLNRLLGSLV